MAKNTLKHNPDIYFLKKEVMHLAKEAKKFGFELMPRLVKEKKFEYTKFEGTLCFKHLKSDNMLRVEKWEIKNLGLDIFKDNIANMFFSILYKQIDDKDYADNYKP
jgi:hypothetical protein